MNKLFLYLSLLIVILCTTSFSLFAQGKVIPPKAEIMIEPTNPKVGIVGVGKFVEQRPGTVTFSIEVSGLSPFTQHAIHIHEFGNCDNNGKAAGGHWNPMQDMHGHLHMKELNNQQAHQGDIGNLLANESGVAKLTMFTDAWCINCEDPKKDILGKAIIIHEGQDDFKTQPTGGAGGRIGCGVIKKDLPISEK